MALALALALLVLVLVLELVLVLVLELELELAWGETQRPQALAWERALAWVPLRTTQQRMPPWSRR